MRDIQQLSIEHVSQFVTTLKSPTINCNVTLFEKWTSSELLGQLLKEGDKLTILNALNIALVLKQTEQQAYDTENNSTLDPNPNPTNNQFSLIDSHKHLNNKHSIKARSLTIQNILI